MYADHPSTDFYLEGILTTKMSWEGIDTFGVIMLHELTHRKHWRDCQTRETVEVSPLLYQFRR